VTSNRVGIAVGRKSLSRAIVGPLGEVAFDQLGSIPASRDSLSVAVHSLLPGTSLPKEFEGAPVRSLTTAAAAVADVFGECVLLAGGERLEVWRDQDGKLQGRSMPADGPDDEGSLKWNEKEIPIKYAAAFAAAMCDPDRVPNHAGRLPGARMALLDRLREPVLNLAAAAALLLAGVGVWFHREKTREEAEFDAARFATVELWSRLLPAESPKEAGLPQAMLRRVGENGGGSGPGALAFWTEIGKHMPDPEPLGLNVESLDLSPEGGRLSARVPAAKDDPLKNAAALEGHLNQSGKLRTRGDYEVRDGHVQVRLRMEFKP
jgi:hypothetical protein